MNPFLFVLICTPLGGALRVVLDNFHTNPDKYPHTTGGCGTILVGAGEDKYILKDMKYAQRLASLDMPEGWCANDPLLSRLPVIYFHDGNVSSDMVSHALEGAEPLFEMFHLGSADHPVMDNFEPLPGNKMFTNYYKWYRPQIFQLSPFKTTLSIDNDAVPCSGAKLAEAFKFFTAAKTAVAAAKHLTGINMGVVIFDTEKARPWAAAWANQLKKCILKNGEVTNDQNSMNAVLKNKHPVSIAQFNDHNICRRAVRTKGCLTKSCWIDHGSRSKTMDEKMRGTTLHTTNSDHIC